jgi:hypothetical protein
MGTTFTLATVAVPEAVVMTLRVPKVPGSDTKVRQKRSVLARTPW